ncbi:hypothetical protein GCM10011608_01010 [Micromonospora sonchi]|uniref:DUF4331 domain-containing protein n=1 Tax=Micromonospora sonchi TaxID=1763543 RepID=A0A917TE57_9ACTN|nr:hypothetical protein GCM10011608_01010 [Micromonospora sonchi]
MSSHREAPEIAKDPVADSSDLYAFVTPNKPDTVTLIANYVPLQLPSGGPNFFEFGDDVRYEIHIDNNGDGEPDVTYRFEFTTEITNPNSFLYNTGPIESLESERREELFRVAGEPVNALDRMNVHSLALQVPLDKAVREVRRTAGTGRPAAGALPGRLRQPRQAEQVEEGPRRPGRDPAHRHPGGTDQRLQQRHR